MHFLGLGAPPRTPLGELKRPQTPCRFQGAASRQGKGKGGERGRRKREKGYWEGKEGGKGREEGRDGGEGGWKGRGGEFASLALGGIDATGQTYILTVDI